MKINAYDNDDLILYDNNLYDIYYKHLKLCYSYRCLLNCMVFKENKNERLKLWNRNIRDGKTLGSYRGIFC